MKTIYECEICSRRSENKSEIESCESQGHKIPEFRIGDFVTTYPRFGWYDGNPRWIATKTKDDSCYDHFRYSFVYFITNITYEVPGERSHIPFYHLETMAMTGNQGYRGGYAPEGRRHMLLHLHEAPELAEEAKSLLGHTFKYLL